MKSKMSKEGKTGLSTLFNVVHVEEAQTIYSVFTEKQKCNNFGLNSSQGTMPARRKKDSVYKLAIQGRTHFH